MPSKGFKRAAVGDVKKFISNLPVAEVIEPEIVAGEVPKKNKGGRPRGSTKGKAQAKTVRDKILARFRIDEFLDLIDTDKTVKKYFYLELIPKMLPRMTEKEVQEKMGVTFLFAEDKKEKKEKPKEEKIRDEKPFVLSLATAPKPEGI